MLLLNRRILQYSFFADYLVKSILSNPAMEGFAFKLLVYPYAFERFGELRLSEIILFLI